MRTQKILAAGAAAVLGLGLGAGALLARAGASEIVYNQRLQSTEADIGSEVLALNQAAIFAATTSGSFQGLPALGSTDLVLGKLKAGGSPAWIRQFGTSAGEAAAGAARDSAGNLYVAAVQGADYGNLLYKFDAGGNPLPGYPKIWRTGDRLQVTDVACAGTTVYVAGRVSNPTRAYLAQFDAAGSLIWEKRVGNGDINSFSRVSVEGLSGGAVLASVELKQSTGTRDLLVVRFNADGTERWQRREGVRTGMFHSPDIAIGGGMVVACTVYDLMQGLVVCWTPNGVRQWRTLVSYPASVYYPKPRDVAVDGANNAVYVQSVAQRNGLPSGAGATVITRLTLAGADRGRQEYNYEPPTTVLSSYWMGGGLAVDATGKPILLQTVLDDGGDLYKPDVAVIKLDPTLMGPAADG